MLLQSDERFAALCKTAEGLQHSICDRLSGTTEPMYTKFAEGERRYAIWPFRERIINVKELYYGLYKNRDGRACVASTYVKITVINTALNTLFI